MATIQHITDDIYCVTLDNLLASIMSTTFDGNQIHTEKNYIFILDNLHLGYKILSLADHCSLSVQHLNAMRLITTYPSVRTIVLNQANLFTEFRKIINNNSKNSRNSQFNDIYNLMFEECIKSLSLVIPNVVIVCTNILHQISNETRELINQIITSGNTTINIYCNHDHMNISPSLKINVVIDDWERNIKEQILSQTEQHNCEIELCGSKLFGSNIIKFHLNRNINKSFLINNRIDNIILDGANINLLYFTPGPELSNIEATTLVSTIFHNNILDAINQLLIFIKENVIILTIDIHKFIKKTLLGYIKNKNSEIINKSVTLYSEYKKIITVTTLNEINNLTISTSGFTDGDNVNLLIEYGKKSVHNTNTGKICSNEIIMKNINIIKTVSQSNNDITIAGMSHINSLQAQITSHGSDKFKESCDFFTSAIMLSSWFDELQNNSCLGLLVKLNSSELVKLGIMHNKNIIVENITNTFLSMTDYVNIATDFFGKDQNIKFGDLNNKNIINGTSIGEANAIIPMYICKEHWIIAKKRIEPLLGIILSHNPFGFIDKYKSIFYVVFVQMTYLLFYFNKNNLNNKYIKTYFAYYRTCAEMCFESKYNYGIRKLVHEYINNPLKRISNNNYPYDKICAQTLVTGYILSETTIGSLILYLLEEIIRTNNHFLIKNNDLINKISALPMGPEKESNIDLLIELLTKTIRFDIDFLKTYYKINVILNEIFIQFGSYGKFIKMLDNNYGLIDENLVGKLFSIINSNLNSEVCILKDLYDLISVDYNKHNVFMYISQGLKHNKNKDRIKAIIDDTYIDIQKIDF